MAANSRDLGVINELQRITGSCVLSNGSTMIVDLSSTSNEIDILKDSAEPDSVVNFGLFFFAESHTLSIATSFNVEHSLVSPDVLIVSDKLAIADSREGSLSSS